MEKEILSGEKSEQLEMTSKLKNNFDLTEKRQSLKEQKLVSVLLNKNFPILVAKEIVDLVPYKPGKPISETKREYGLNEVTKLASNENPIGTSPKVFQAIQNALSEIHRYPDASCYELLQQASKYFQVKPEQILVGNGSNELIDLIIRVVCQAGDSIFIAEKSFLAYAISAQSARVNVINYPLHSGFVTDLKGMADYLKTNAEKENIKVVFVPNPNNPTGTYNSADQVENFLKITSQIPNLLVVFDEAYHEFVRATDYRSALEFQGQFPNVVVLRTMSKAFGLAGLRIGFMIADPKINDLIHRIRNPFNINELAQVAAVAAFQDIDFVKKSAQMTWEGLDYFYAQLKKMNISYTPSEGNFVLIDTGAEVTETYESLLKLGVIFRPVKNYGLPNHMRLSVGQKHENELAIEKLKLVLKKI